MSMAWVTVRNSPEGGGHCCGLCASSTEHTWKLALSF